MNKMRLRARSTYKLLILFVVCCVVLLICINYFTDYNKRDEFLIELPPSKDISQHQQTQHHTVTAQRLLNLSSFEYTIKNEICQKTDKELLAIIIVTSYAGHDELRSSHRSAIPQSKLAEMGFQRVFLLAEIPSKERFIKQQQLLNEHQRFGDLVQGNFQESYRNLSYKHIMGLSWAATECARAKFIIKLDDDIVFDVFQLRRYLETVEVEQAGLVGSADLLAGYIIEGKAPIRNVASKWYVSPQEYSADKYPDYLSGWLYITNVPTARRFVSAAQNASIFWIDDTWVTGILREGLGIPMQRLNNWYSANSQFLECCVRDLKASGYECEYYVGPNGGDAKLLVDFLHNVEKCYFDECVKRPPQKTLKDTCVATAKHVLPEHGDAQIKQIKLR